MKKVVSLLLAIIMVVAISTVVNATTSSELADKIYAKGKAYGMSKDNYVRIERYLSQNPVTDAQADQIMAKVDEIAKVFDNANATKYSQLSNSQLDQIKKSAVEMGKIVDLTVKFETKKFEVYKNNKLVETVTYDGNRLVYTGNNVTPIIVVSSVVVALVATFTLRKKFANA